MAVSFFPSLPLVPWNYSWSLLWDILNEINAYSKVNDVFKQKVILRVKYITHIALLIHL